jgi:DNA-binding transcriptional LysR family regulator
MNIELRHLRYFVAVAEEASFTGAARRVHVAQQVLSTQIRQLEEAVGAVLLRRTSRGVVLTPAGAAFLDSARATLAGLERGVAAALHAAASVSGRLSVGLSVAAAGEMRTRLLTSFAGAYPAVELELLTYDLTAPAAGLLDHRTDVALIRPPVDAPGITLDEVESEPRVFVLAAGHPLASPRPGGDVPVIGAEARTIDEWREHVVAGHGISLCPASSEEYNARPGLVFVPGKGVPVTSLCVARREGDERPVVRSFVELALSVAGDLDLAHPVHPA